MNYLAALACLLGAILQVAVNRAPDFVDKRKTATTARRIAIVAMFVATFYMLWSEPSTMASLIFGLFGMSQMLFAFHNLKLDLDLHFGPHP